jgi:hypothetical protein
MFFSSALGGYNVEKRSNTVARNDLNARDDASLADKPTLHSDRIWLLETQASRTPVEPRANYSFIRSRTEGNVLERDNDTVDIRANDRLGVYGSKTIESPRAARSGPGHWQISSGAQRPRHCKLPHGLETR